jgi:hypothetical protein
MHFDHTSLSFMRCGASTCAFRATVDICGQITFGDIWKRFIMEISIPGHEMTVFRDNSPKWQVVLM